MASPDPRVCAPSLFLLALVALAPGCGESGGPDGGMPDAVLRRPDFAMAGWSTETVATGNVGLHADLAVKADGSLVMAWFSSQATLDGPCVELGDAPPTRNLWNIDVATGQPGSLSVSTVRTELEVGVPTGLDLEIDPGDRWAIATRLGEPLPLFGFCGVNDLALITEGGGEEILVTSSGEAVTGEAGSDFGEVIGQWPGLAFGPGGRAVIGYRDVHAGGRQSDDIRRADFEAAYNGGGGWTPVAIDFGDGAGVYSRAAFTSDGTAYLIYVNNVEQQASDVRGVYVTRSADGATWETVRVAAAPTTNGPDIAVDEATDTVMVAWYDAGLGQAQVATLTDPAQFDDLAAGWDIESVGDPRYDEGVNPSLDIGPDGTVGLAYYRCVLASEGLGECNFSDDGLVFAYSFGGPWFTEEVDAGDARECGRYPALAMTAAGPRIAYLCQDDPGDGAQDTVRLATRGTL